MPASEDEVGPTLFACFPCKPLWLQDRFPLTSSSIPTRPAACGSLRFWRPAWNATSQRPLTLRAIHACMPTCNAGMRKQFSGKPRGGSSAPSR